MPALEPPRPASCPRVVGSDDGKLVACGNAIPCPYHGAPLFVVNTPPIDRTAPTLPPHPHSIHCSSRCVNTLTLDLDDTDEGERA